jgi:AcrR family transcriptional regulator
MGSSEYGVARGGPAALARCFLRMIHAMYARRAMIATPTTAPIATPAIAPLDSPALLLKTDSGGAVGWSVGLGRGVTPDAGLGVVVADDRSEDEV